MNRIYRVFDDIKVSDNTKKKLYEAIASKSSKKSIMSCNYMMRYSFVMGSVIILLIAGVLLSQRDDKVSLDKNKDLMNTKQYEYNIDHSNIIYNGNIYVKEDATIKREMLDKKLGKLIELESDSILANSYAENSYYHPNATLYTIKDISNYEKLAILIGDEIFLFRLVSE